MSQAAGDTAPSLKNLTGAIRAVAVTTEDKNSQLDVIDTENEVIIHSAKIIKEAQPYLQNPQAGLSPGIATTTKDITRVLDRAFGCLSGQKEVDNYKSTVRDGML